MPRSRMRGGVGRGAVEVLPHLPVADAAHRRQAEMQVTARAQPAHLVDQAAGQHRIESFRDAARAATARSDGSSAITR